MDAIQMRNFLLVWHLKDWSLRGSDGKKVELKTTEEGALDDETIKKSLRQVLSRKQLSIPSICQHLHIARSRFTAFERRHKGFLGKKGKGKLTVYFLKNAST